VPIEQIGRLDPPRDHVRQAGEPDEFDTKYVIDVCADAVKEHPRIARYALNLARAEHAHALNPRNSEKVRAEYLERARFDYERLAEAGEPLAMANLVAAYDEGVGDAALDGKTSGIDPKNALKLLSQAAQQGLALAQFRLANLYLSGWPEAELQSDLGEYRHWMGLAARQGYVAAIVAEASSERLGVGTNRRNPVLAAELFKRAARLGSNEAEFQLGLIYLSGATGDSDQAASGQQDSKKDKASSQALQDLDDPNSVASDDEQALIWFGRAADHGNAAASLYMSYLLENARGVKDPQPQIAARYLRAAAEAGNADAQVDYVNKIFDGTILLRFDDADEVIDTLLKRAMKAGNGRAALLLAARAWPDDPHLHRDARLAAAYAFAAIDLAAMANPAGDYWQNDFSPLTEIAAGHFLIMLAHQPDGTDEQGKPLFSKAETDLLEKYYGKYDETQHRVVVKMADFFDYANAVPQDSTVRKQLWIWDWGRVESPTEQQFRRIELWRGTTFYDHVRDSYFLKERNDVNTMKSHPEYVTQNMLRTAIGDVYSLSRNIKTSFVELLGNKLEIIGRQP
jgi:TPR repeat protein